MPWALLLCLGLGFVSRRKSLQMLVMTPVSETLSCNLVLYILMKLIFISIVENGDSGPDAWLLP
jgi:hypothetical protein